MLSLCNTITEIKLLTYGKYLSCLTARQYPFRVIFQIRDALRKASILLRAPSFLYAFLMCFFTVSCVMPSSPAISFCFKPSPTSFSTLSSRLDKSVSVSDPSEVMVSRLIQLVWSQGSENMSVLSIPLLCNKYEGITWSEIY